MKQLFLFSFCLLIWLNVKGQASFTVPDTVCINDPVNITNTSVGASTYYWNFCGYDLYGTPTLTDLGNPGNLLYVPTFITIQQDNGIWYGFVSNFGYNSIVRLTYGSSLLNTPTAENLGTFGGDVPEYTEGLQVVKDVNGWHLIVVGGYTPAKARIMKIDFGASLGTPRASLTSTNWGNINNTLDYPTELSIIQEGNDYWGLTVNANGNTVTRFYFGSNFTNPPTAQNLGNVTGTLNWPTGIYAAKYNNQNYIFVTNTYAGTLVRMDFGSSIGNTPVSTDLGNAGGVLTQPRDIAIINDCGNFYGLVVNNVSHDVVRVDFPSGVNGAITGSKLNITGLTFPHSISTMFRDGDNLYSMIADADAHKIFRLQFNSCTNSSTPSSTSATPPSPIKYDSAGIYNIHLLTNESLSTQSSFCKEVVVLAPPKPNLGKDTATCGAATITLDAGAGRTYLWNTGAKTRTIAVSTTGDYSVTVSNGYCEGKDTIHVAINQPLDLSNTVVTNIDCAGTLGQLDVRPTGGMYPFTYYLNGTNQGKDSLYTNLNKGTYTVRVVDAIGCEISRTFTVDQLTTLKPNLGKDTATCGAGTVTLDAGNGITYLWNTGATTRTIVASGTGDYIVTVNNGFCEGKDTIHVTINQPLNLSNTVVTDVDCAGTPGRIDVRPTGGTYPYTYYLNGISHGRDSLYTSMDSGTYAIRIVDAIGCTLTQSFTVGQLLPQPKPNLGKDTGSCGTAAVTLDAGAGSTYIWNTGETTRTIVATTSGDYSVTVSNGVCEASDTIHVTITKPLTLSNTVVTNIDCGVEMGQIEVMPTGGKYPYTYYFNGVNHGTDSLYPKLDPGTYTIKVVDALGCELAQAFTVVEYTANIIRATASGTKPTCYDATDGSITIQVNKGVPPFEYTIDTFKTFQTRPVITGLQQGNYHIYIRNAVCIDSVSIELPAPAPLKTGVALTNELCERGNGTLEVHPSGGTSPYKFYWGSDLMTQTSLSNLSSGTYSIMIRDAHNCRLDTAVTIENNNIDAVHIWNRDTTINIGQSVTLKATNSVDYTWTPDESLSCTDCASPVATPDSTTTYIVSTVTGLNCIPTDTVTVTVTHYKRLFIPTAFTPNGDGQNDVFRVKGLGIAYFNMRIYNRVGNLIYQTKDYAGGWDGKVQDALAPVGTYVYVIEYAFFDDVVHPKLEKGTVTLIR